jgi:hypothetical protein
VIVRAAAVLFSVLVPASAGSGPRRPALALTATPAHVTIVGTEHRVLRVTNRGTETLVVDAAAAGLTLGLHGAPRLLFRGAAARRAASWLRIRPARIVLAGGASAEVGVGSALPRAAEPGDHAALVLLTTRAPYAGAGVGLRLRIGITVVVRVPGRIRHVLRLRALHPRRGAGNHVLRLVVVNAGNVVESLRSGAIEVSLLVGKGVVATLRSPARELLPRSKGVIDIRYPGDVRRPFTARVTVTPRAGPVVRRTFRLVGNE